MAMNSVQTLGAPASTEIPEDAEIGNASEEEIERLESDVSQMAEKILRYRTNLPDQLKQALDLLKSAERFDVTSSRPGTSGDSDQGYDCAVPKQCIRSRRSHAVGETSILLFSIRGCLNLASQMHAILSARENSSAVLFLSPVPLDYIVLKLEKCCLNKDASSLCDAGQGFFVEFE
ncbi:uncharacterized protein LOC115748630 isoform X1 [Rhodamnia argentea]|uniref:Uncharacterized protein LOC115748630 isoform X1 n=1 Tax=Rhodamnia argentea TaxID=178133 RepID=A0ABM3HYF4_9MYRT|nr:uncharacterized protein LOC115748630 isoform X1 [Rhodamnia argentea]